MGGHKYSKLSLCLKRFLETVLINTGLKSLLQDNSRRMTMFAPVDGAFSQMTKDSPSYLNRQNESQLKNVSGNKLDLDFVWN